MCKVQLKEIALHQLAPHITSQPATADSLPGPWRITNATFIKHLLLSGNKVTWNTVPVPYPLEDSIKWGDKHHSTVVGAATEAGSEDVGTRVGP